MRLVKVSAVSGASQTCSQPYLEYEAASVSDNVRKPFTNVVLHLLLLPDSVNRLKKEERWKRSWNALFYNLFICSQTPNNMYIQNIVEHCPSLRKNLGQKWLVRYSVTEHQKLPEIWSRESRMKSSSSNDALMRATVFFPIKCRT